MDDTEAPPAKRHEEDYEALADAFEKETGVLAPGRTYPRGRRAPHTKEERWERYLEWLTKRIVEKPERSR